MTLYLKYLPLGELRQMSETQLKELLIEPATGFDATWDVAADLLIQKDFTWDTSETDELFWFRIEGSCASPTGEGVGVEPGDSRCDTSATIQGQTVENGFKLLTAIAAKGVSDLCEKMGQNQLFPPIQTQISSIKKYSRPALRSSYQQYDKTGHGLTQAPVDNSINTLTEVEFQTIPECMGYALEDNGLMTTGGGYAVATDTLFQATGSGGITMDGAAEAFWVIGPAQHGVPTGGITMGGGAGFEHYQAEGSGGVIMGGSPWFE